MSAEMTARNLNGVGDGIVESGTILPKNIRTRRDMQEMVFGEICVVAIETGVGRSPI